jgi:hypothetical protein
MRFYARVIPEALFRELRRAGRVFSEEGFVLGGGTAVALWFGHRRSEDPEFFREEPMPYPEVVAERLRREAGLFVRAIARGTIHGSLAGSPAGLFEYPYPTIRPPVFWRRCGLWVLTPDDLAAMKLAAVVQRGVRKDFVDIYALGLRHRPLVEMIRLYQRRFGIGDPGPVLRALTYFEDAEASPLPPMLWDVSWERIRETVAAWAYDAGRRL